MKQTPMPVPIQPYHPYPVRSYEDQRFFFGGPLLPFAAGLVAGPLLISAFARPPFVGYPGGCYPPYCGPGGPGYGPGYGGPGYGGPGYGGPGYGGPGYGGPGYGPGPY
ncbi:penicillin-binding protein [Pontibacillus halophilus]|uniref:penicillin-binding protein n=1 Tax=Pontibacillus halophilus TaxID=516704 RepID=UPI0003FE9286|nr:penicillin-binding protein [Pontibacillus halophilus]